MRPSAWWLVGMLGVMLASAPAASAQVTVAITPTADGQSVIVQTAGSCGSSAGCQVQVQVDTVGDAGGTCVAPASLQGGQPVSSSDGTFDFTSTFPQGGGGQYQACAYVIANGLTIATSSPAFVTVPAPPCAPGTPHALMVTVPPRLVSGRTGTVDVGTSLTSQAVSSGTVTMQEFSAAAPFRTYTFTAADLDNLNNGGNKYLPIELGRGAGPARVTVTDQQDKSDTSYEQCVDEVSATVQPVAGALPKVRLGTYNGTVRIAAPGGCSATQVVSVSVRTFGSGADSTLRTPDVCRAGSWQVVGGIPGVATSREFDGGGSTITFRLVGAVNAQYHMVISVGHVVRYALMTVFDQSTPATRVFQGTDAFVNYCIDQSKTIYSYHLRLFCWKPGSTSSGLILTS